MTQKILRLSEKVINQIAAGEVVENPASIVKELLENSIDAGSSRIEIRMEMGGFSLLEVEDNGVGMNSLDAVLCLERHATSKIQEAEDLFSLETMGFRGEALAAIASIAHLELKTSEGGIGTRVLAEGGVISQVVPCARNRGTTIVVRDLFFNTPARKKFQKSARASVAQITRLVEILSFAHPEIHFSLVSQGEKIVDVSAKERKMRIEEVLGPFPHLVEDDFVWGLFGAPSDAKNHRRSQFLFVNKRSVFSPLISKAVQMGYGTRMKENMHPSFVLLLQADPKDIDINIHPQKKEIKFSDEHAVFQKIEGLVDRMFGERQPFIQNPSFSFTPAPLPWEMPVSFVSPAEQIPLPIDIPAKPLAVVGKFLLLEKEGLLLIDLAAARFRILFEESFEKTKEMQPLLIPLEMDLEDMELLPELVNMGLECRHLGKNKIVIDAVRVSLDMSEIADWIACCGKGRKREEIASDFCTRFHKKYSLEEAFCVWRHLQFCRDTLYDPLGKKIWTKVESRDLSQWLK